MEINMKGYDLESFKEKDIWTWDEILAAIQDLELEKKSLEEELNDLKTFKEDTEEDRYEDIRLGLI